MQVERHRQARQPRARGVAVDNDEADRRAAQAQHRNARLGLDEYLETLRRDAQEEAAEQLHDIAGVGVGRTALLDLQRTDDLDSEGFGRQHEGLALGPQVELAVLGIVVEEVGGAEFLGIDGIARDDLPLLAADDGLNLGAGDIDELVAGFRDIGIDGAQRRGEGRRHVDLAQHRGRQAANREIDVLANHVALDTFQRDGLGLGRIGGVDLQQRAAFDEDAVVLEEVEVGLDLRDTPEFRAARDRGTGLQNEARRRRTDVAQLDDLDGAGCIDGEALDDVAVGQLEVADLQRDLAADIDDRLVGEAQALQLDAAGNLDIEHAADALARLPVVLLEG